MAKWTASALVLALLALLAPSALGHGWITEPPARNAASNPRNGHCPHCGNGGGVCGDGGQWPGSSNYLGGQNAGPQRTYTAGEVVEIKVRITAHHRGHMELHVCDEHLGPLTPDPEGPNGCLSRWALTRVPPAEVHDDCRPDDPRGDCQPLDAAYPERWYLPPGAGEHTMHFRIPEGLQCESCTLQWRWWTANSCIPADGYGCYFQHMGALGWDATAWCGAFCGSCSNALLQSNASQAQQRALSQRMGCGEEFRNCADIRVLAGSGATTASPATTQAPSTTMATTQMPATTGSPATTRAPSTTMATTQMPATTGSPTAGATTAPMSTPSPSTTAMGTTTAATACASCAETYAHAPCVWTDGNCYPVAEEVCQATQGAIWCGGAEPEPEPEPQGCKAKPGNNGGATDAYCAQCETGYQWWPCNNPALCEGSGCVLSAMQLASQKGAQRKKISPHNHGFLATALIQAGAALERVLAPRREAAQEL